MIHWESESITVHVIVILLTCKWNYQDRWLPAHYFSPRKKESLPVLHIQEFLKSISPRGETFKLKVSDVLVHCRRILDSRTNHEWTGITRSNRALFGFTDDVAVVGGENGVHFTFSREGRPSGEAFVELVDEDNVQLAVTKHNEHMGNRYIEGLLE